MKKLATIGILMIILGLTMQNKEIILKQLNTFFYPRKEVVLGEKNEYYREYDFNFVQNTDDFIPENKNDLINIYYTAINAGKDTFSFYCSEEYESCISDVRNIANDQTILSDINNFVHPFNGFTHIETEYDSLGEVRITIIHSYTEQEIQEIKAKIEQLKPSLINPNLTPEQNIKTIHDYIINNSKYDSDRSEKNIITYKSDIAYGPLLQGYGICGGYTDAMQLFLEELGIKNFKISSDSHIWNAVYLNNTWHHLDLTWDDPITSNKIDVLDHNFFLINTNQLLSIEQTEHNFNQEIYSELKQA